MTQGLPRITPPVADPGTYDTVVAHGATAGTARPAGAVHVLWVGTVEPSNGSAADLYLDSATPGLYALVGVVWTAVGAGGGGLTTEQVQDIVGAMDTDSSSVDFTYDDTAGTVTAIIKAGSVTEAMLAFSVATQAELDAVSTAAANASNLTSGTLPVARIAAGSLTADKFAALTITTQTGSYTAVLADTDTLVRMDVAGANTFTVPPNSSVAFEVGRTILVSQKGAGQVTLTPGAGVTINSRGGALKTAGQYAQVSVTKVGTDEWLAAGDLTT